MDSIQDGFDWNKNKDYQIKKRGNLSLLATSTFKSGAMVSSPVRCVWPGSLLNTDSKIISRRVWGKLS